MTPEENREAEARLAERMGQEEAVRVARAVAASSLPSVTVSDEGEVRRRLMAATLTERERCLAICRKWPDNLMAKQIAKEIQEGPK